MSFHPLYSCLAMKLSCRTYIDRVRLHVQAIHCISTPYTITRSTRPYKLSHSKAISLGTLRTRITAPRRHAITEHRSPSPRLDGMRCRKSRDHNVLQINDHSPPQDGEKLPRPRLGKSLRNLLFDLHFPSLPNTVCTMVRTPTPSIYWWVCDS